MSKADVNFAGLPARVLGDDRLKFLHWRVLAVIAVHDRLSLSERRKAAKAKGCTASRHTLMTKVCCNYARLSSTISDLVKWGYLESEVDPARRRDRTLRVIYNEDDEAYMGSVENLPTRKDSNERPDPKVCAQANIEDSLPGPNLCLQANDTPTNVCAQANGSAELFAWPSGKALQNHEVDLPKKFRETGRNSVETGRYSAEAGINSAEAARFASRHEQQEDQNSINVGGELARFERAFNENPLTLDLDGWAAWLQQVYESFAESDETLFRQADRLLEAISLHREYADQVMQPHHGDEPELIKSFYWYSGKAGRAKLAKFHGLNSGELTRFVEGKAKLHHAKVASMGRTIRNWYPRNGQQVAL